MGHASLIHGWFPVAVQFGAAVCLLLSMDARQRVWWTRWFPAAILVGLATGAAAWWYAQYEGLSGEPAPVMLWVWIGLAGTAAVVMLARWLRSRWWVRVVSLAAIPLCVLAATLVLNVWVGYVQTMAGAWNHLTEGPLPDEMGFEAALEQAKAGQVPATGAIVRIDSGQANSGFRHRGELVYLPPNWFQPNRPDLPMVVMVGGSMGTSSDWVRAGAVVSTVDAFAKEHGGNAPVLAFPDVNGAFNNDTECVNGTRGNAADHVIKDFVPYVSSNFGVGNNRDSRAIVGWSMGGTCAVTLTTLHPEVFGAFIDMDGDLGPNVGNRQQTIDRLYGGHADEWKRFDAMSILKQNGDYTSVSGYFAVEGDGSSSYTVTPGLPQGFIPPTAHLAAARVLCALGRVNGMTCAVVVHPGKHDWQFAAEVFKVALPWLAGELGVPAVQKVALPPD